MRFESEDLIAGQPVPAHFALGVYDPQSHVTFADNVSPDLQWGDLPEGARSLALICVDIDVPTKPDDVNQEGKTVPFDLPRGRFYHWCLANIPADVMRFSRAEWGSGVTPRGKSESIRHSVLIGKNDYTGWFAGDADMEGTYLGYDGPCPPWNDERIHRYRFELYAVDMEKLDLPEAYAGDELVRALEGHVLDQATFTCTYQIYPDARMPE